MSENFGITLVPLHKCNKLDYIYYFFHETVQSVNKIKKLEL